MKPSSRLNRTLLIAVAILLSPVASTAQAPKEPSTKPNLFDRILGLKQDPSGGWLFVGSKKSGETGIYMAVSKDGYAWSYVSDGKPIIRQSERNELMLDPFIQHDPDGTFRMVWRWSANSPAIGYSTSIDLLHWSKNRKLLLTQSIPVATYANSPSIYYRESTKDWLILWSSGGALADKPATPPTSLATPNDRIYFSTTTDFKRFTPAKLFFDPGFSVTDPILLGSGMPGLFYLIFTDERPSDRTFPLGKRIFVAEGPSMIGPWQRISDPVTDPWTEAAAPIQVADGLLLYYHHAHNPQSTTGHDPQDYGAAFSKDMVHWTDDSLRISFPSGIQHGSFIHISTDEYNMLHHFYLRFDAGLQK